MYKLTRCAIALAITLQLAGCGGSGGASNGNLDRSGTTKTDCAPDDPSRWQMLTYTSTDADSDGYFVNSSGQVCSGSSLATGFSTQAVATSAADCDDFNPARWQLLAFVAVDTDGDSHPVNLTGQVCSGKSLPDGYFSEPTDPADVDCDDSISQVWQQLAFESRDADSDAHYVTAAGQVCSGTTLPTAYRADPTASEETDCDDADSNTWRMVATYVDGDGDGVGAGEFNMQCIGATASAGKSLLGYDPNDSLRDPASTAESNFDLSPAILTTP